MFFKTVALTIAIAGLGTTFVMGAANAATPSAGVPLCSRSITDNCMNPSQAPKARHAPARHHVAHRHTTRAAHHHANKVAARTVHKAAPRKG